MHSAANLAAAGHSMNDARKLGEQAIAGGLDYSTSVGGDLYVALRLAKRCFAPPDERQSSLREMVELALVVAIGA